MPHLKPARIAAKSSAQRQQDATRPDGVDHLDAAFLHRSAKQIANFSLAALQQMELARP